MRLLLALLAIVVLGLAIWWGLAERTNAPRPEDQRSDDVAPEAPREAPAETTRTFLAGAPQPRRVSIEELLAQGKVGNGSLLVTLVPEKGMAPPSGVRIDVEAIDIPAAAYPLAVVQDDGSWLFERLPIGRWRVRAHVSGARAATETVTVAPRKLTETTIRLTPGAEAAWRVAVEGREPPDAVRVALLDGRGVAVAATYQTAFTTLHAAPGKAPALPLEGKVIGLAPGPYRFRAWFEGGDSDEKPFEVRVGEQPTIELRLVTR